MMKLVAALLKYQAPVVGSPNGVRRTFGRPIVISAVVRFSAWVIIALVSAVVLATTDAITMELTWEVRGAEVAGYK